MADLGFPAVGTALMTYAGAVDDHALVTRTGGVPLEPAGSHRTRGVRGQRGYVSLSRNARCTAWSTSSYEQFGNAMPPVGAEAVIRRAMALQPAARTGAQAA
jgi:hypothetical protein